MLERPVFLGNRIVVCKPDNLRYIKMDIALSEPLLCQEVDGVAVSYEVEVFRNLLEAVFEFHQNVVDGENCGHVVAVALDAVGEDNLLDCVEKEEYVGLAELCENH